MPSGSIEEANGARDVQVHSRTGHGRDQCLERLGYRNTLIAVGIRDDLAHIRQGLPSLCLARFYPLFHCTFG